MHAITAQQQIIGEFAADQASSYDQHGFGGSTQGLMKTRQILQLVDRLHLRRSAARHRQADWFSTRGQHQIAVGQTLGVARRIVIAKRARHRIHAAHQGMG